MNFINIYIYKYIYTFIITCVRVRVYKGNPDKMTKFGYLHIFRTSDSFIANNPLNYLKITL